MTRGSGAVFRRVYRDRDTRKKRTSSTWSIRFYDRKRGRQIREGGFKSERAAERRLRAQLTDQDRGLDVGARHQRTTLADLEKLVLADYKANGRRSLDHAVQCFTRVKNHFGQDARAVDIDEHAITGFVAARLEAGGKPATVNRDLGALRRGFRLAYWSQRVPRVPKFRLLAEDNVRKGFFERDQLEAVLAQLPADLQLLVELAYATGWRWRSELVTREWRHVDLVAGWLRLEPGETKSREGRQFPLKGRLLKLLRDHQQATKRLEKKLRRVIPWVFYRDAQQHNPATVRSAWERAVRDAGLPGRLLHDFRRTAVRNLERAGVSRSAAMAMVGHRTEAIYRRYAIVAEGDLQDAAAKLELLFHKVGTKKGGG
jgi:integrase